jgi:fatty-acyl-CoA synthase
VDRAKDMIITGRGAANVFSRTVEDVLVSHPQVRSAAVIGVPDAVLGEAVYAYVVAVPGAGVTGDELRALVAAGLRDYCVPSVVEFTAELPLTGMGKVDKKALWARHAAAGPDGTGGPDGAERAGGAGRPGGTGRAEGTE